MLSCELLHTTTYILKHTRYIILMRQGFPNQLPVLYISCAPGVDGKIHPKDVLQHEGRNQEYMKDTSYIHPCRLRSRFLNYVHAKHQASVRIIYPGAKIFRLIK